MIDKQATPDKVGKGSLVLQPSEERRRSGSHYTPRTLTEPIVRTTLEPILSRLKSSDGNPPKPEQILGLKVCDPAMGSGAFLVEACRQLADSLLESWAHHGGRPALPPDEDEVVFARRLVAQRCLYGVDKNPMAVDLAKVSLWLVTLAKDHSFTFLDHSLRHGDSLVGLNNEKIFATHWDEKAAKTLFDQTLPDRILQSASVREKISKSNGDEYDTLVTELGNAQAYIRDLRLVGDSVIAAFFQASKPKDRLTFRFDVMEQARLLFTKTSLDQEIEPRQRLEAWAYWLRSSERVPPFHWELEFPEVFSREDPGFDGILGNPPFISGTQIWPLLGGSYCDYLRIIHSASGGKAVDLVAHFFRRSFNLIRHYGCLGLVATKTICQGDTRDAGLKYICRSGGSIYSATRRLPWPGTAAVTVSVVHISKQKIASRALLDRKFVPAINSYLSSLMSL